MSKGKEVLDELLENRHLQDGNKNSDEIKRPQPNIYIIKFLFGAWPDLKVIVFFFRSFIC